MIRDEVTLPDGTIIIREYPEPPPPPPPVPAEIQMWQARAILSRAGLLTNVNAAVAASTNEEVKIAWEYAPNVVRKSNFVLAMAGALGLDDATLDTLFIEGAKIK
jgi:hypothetical protein